MKMNVSRLLISYFWTDFYLLRPTGSVISKVCWGQVPPLWMLSAAVLAATSLIQTGRSLVSELEQAQY